MIRASTLGVCLAIALLALAGTASGAKTAKPKRPDAKAAMVPPAPVAPPGPKSLADTLSGPGKADYDAAKVLYSDGDFAGARVKFQNAYEQSHDPRLLWNMAACEKGLRHYAKVIVLIREYLGTGGDLLIEQDRRDAQDLLSAIETFTVSLRIDVTEDGADVSVDDEVVGTSPLKEPIVVDIGSRKIRVTKAGFKSFEATIPVGGSKDARQEVKLERDVHEGTLGVHSSAEATIAIDGKEVGAGSWSGTLPSGGHTLFVSAPGMRPYQSEVVIGDKETRTVDVLLEAIPLVAPGPEQHGALYGMELGVRTGYGKAYRRGDENPGILPLWLDIGYRLGTPTLLGIYGQYGWIDRSATCGIDRHGASPAFTGDPATRFAYSSCRFAKFGVQLLFHTLPRTIVDPWFGFDAAIHASFARYRSYEPTTGQYGEGNDDNASFQPGFQLGIDVHPWRDLGLGPFFTAGPEFGGEGKANNDANVPCGGQGQPTCGNSSSSNSCGQGGCSNDSQGPGFHWLLGVRVAYTFH